MNHSDPFIVKVNDKLEFRDSILEKIADHICGDEKDPFLLSAIMF